MSGSLNFATLPSVVIANAATISNIIDSKFFEDAVAITLYAPTTLDAFTFTIRVAEDIAGVFVTLSIGDPIGNAAPPLANLGQTYFELVSVGAFQILSSSAVAAERTWRCTKQYRS